MTPYEQRAVNGRWWAAKSADRGKDLYGLCKYLRTAEGQKQRRQDDRHHMRLYGNYDVSGAASSPRDSAIAALVARRGSDRMRYNMLRSAVDSAASVIAQQRPRPMFLTTGGRFDLQRAARLRTRAIEGQFYDLGAYDLFPLVFIDGAVLGTGAIYGYLGPDGRPRIERVLPMELIVDHDAALDAKPTEIYRIYTVARDTLAGLYERAKQRIGTSEGPDQAAREDLFLTRDTKADRVLVCEGWHLESYPGADDGRHVIATSNATLVDEPYRRRRLPFAVYRWAQRQVGFWGCGIVECGRDPQWRINRLIARYETQNNRGASFYLLVEGNSKVRHEAITNTPGEIIRYFGTAPQWQQSPGAHPGIQAEIDSIREQFFSEQGISQMTAEGKKPAGLNSGAAQRIHDDLLSRRHVMNARNYEAAFLDVADLLVDLNDQAAEIDPEYSVDALESRGRSQGVRAVRWADLSEEKGDFRMRMFPTSALPTTPAGKMETVQEWISTGFVSRPFAMSLLDFPDIDAAARVELADLDFAMWQVEQIMEGEDVTPDEYADLKLCADIARRARLQAAIDGAPESILQALADHADACLELSAAGEMALQPQPATPPAGPPAQAQAALSAVPGGQAMIQ